ncbi:MAG TPA: hypothetical protein VE991_13765, partial [Acidimicrobiales bacterium]|nr:hypothetical protein [Acidimicrobiales bacterium]
GIPGTGLDWEAVYGGSNGSATCDDQNSFGVGFSNVDNSSRQYGFFDITGYYGGSASTSTILGDTIIDVPASQSETFNDGTSENFTVTNVTGPGVVQSSDGWEFDLAGATPPSNN